MTSLPPERILISIKKEEISQFYCQYYKFLLSHGFRNIFLKFDLCYETYHFHTNCATEHT